MLNENYDARNGESDTFYRLLISDSQRIMAIRKERERRKEGNGDDVNASHRSSSEYDVLKARRKAER